MSGGGSTLAVYTAIGANVLVMSAKLVGAVMTGSPAMLAEAIHSLADVGNQSLLAVGIKKSTRPPDEEHPFGYGKDAFVWAMISAVGIFFLGCGVSVAHGVHSLMAEGHHEESHSGLALWILLFSLVIESMSFAVAMRELARGARERGVGFFRNLVTTDDVFGIAIILEDTAAVLGVFVALGSVWVTRVTGDPQWDAYGAIVIGVLLGAVAMFLVSKNRALLLGRSIPESDLAALHEVLATDPAVRKVLRHRGEVVGVEGYRITAKLDLDSGWFADQALAGHDVAALLSRSGTEDGLRTVLREFGATVVDRTGDEIDRIEDRIRQRLPRTQFIAIEPDHS